MIFLGIRPPLKQKFRTCLLNSKWIKKNTKLIKINSTRQWLCPKKSTWNKCFSKTRWAFNQSHCVSISHTHTHTHTHTNCIHTTYTPTIFTHLIYKSIPYQIFSTKNEPNIMNLGVHIFINTDMYAQQIHIKKQQSNGRTM